MQVQVKQWGNSFAVRIPKKALEEAQIFEGDTLELNVEKGHVSMRKKLTPEELDAIFDELKKYSFSTNDLKYTREELYER